MTGQKTWDTRYEWRVIVLLTLAFGLVGLDRFAINPLFPSMMRDLNLDYQDLGNVSAVLAVSWGIACALMGPLSDRLGRRKTIIPAVLAFSAMASLTGLVNGIATLLLLRVVMGLAEGAFMPGSIAATIEAAKPSRRGFLFGIQQNGLPIIGLGVGPIIATQLLALTGSWRWTFCIVALPGFILAFLLLRTLRDTQGTVGAAETAETASKHSWRDLLRYRNIVLAILIMICVAGSLNVVIAMTPSYLVDYLKVETKSMGFIASGIGLGALVGGVILPALSDRVGRKPVMLGSAVAAALSLYGFMISPAAPLQLFLLLSGVSAFAFSAIYINVGPLSMESVPATMSSSAVGAVVGVGEIVGGGLAPALAGYIAKHQGIEHVFTVGMVGMAAAVVLILFLKEPRKVVQQAPAVA